ncbi:P-loop containing nucleoside triphosphate hydrolase protein [Mycena polygramma]|nr:P-loop containing nucleoside triphosphate hydrolase protein [Mycena polygramma]
MVSNFSPRFGREPYPWQLDVGEAFVLKLDGVIIAGTGAGKTIPFMLPLLINPTKYILVISPLKVLQHDQAKRFRKMKLSAAAVNGDTYSAAIQEGLESGKYQAIFTSPEMCLQHPGFRKWLHSEQATENILGLIIDEAHCISQWGGDFRKLYAMLDQLRVLFPLGTPVHAFSATLQPDALAEVCSSLSINLGKAFFLNLGNDRPNITPSVVRMKGSSDYSAVDQFLPNPETVHSFEDLPKSLLFVNAVKKSHKLCQHVRKIYGGRFDENIAFLHAHRTRRAKRAVMRKFRQGKIRILVATEAAGMGADIPDIELVIQFGFPKSLSVWIQRAGRAGRSPDIQARAILLVEQRAFQRRKRRKRKKPAAGEASDSGSSDSSSESEAEAGGNTVPPAGTAAPAAPVPPAGTAAPTAPATQKDDGREWGKKVEEALRKYASTRSCRRDVTDDYFNNPARRAPTGQCCDNCSSLPPPPSPEPEETRSQTPDSSPTSSAHSTPSKSVNSNGKRPMRRPRGDGPAARRGEHLQNVRAALNRFRVKMVLSDRYSQTSFSPEVILPDPTLKTLASNARIKTVEDIVSVITNPPWMMAQRHGQEVLDLIARLDRAERDERNARTIANREARKRQTAAKKANKNTPSTPTPLPGPSSGVLTDTSNLRPAPSYPVYSPFYPARHPVPSTPVRTLPLQMSPTTQSPFFYYPYSPAPSTLPPTPMQHMQQYPYGYYPHTHSPHTPGPQ